MITQECRHVEVIHVHRGAVVLLITRRLANDGRAIQILVAHLAGRIALDRATYIALGRGLSVELFVSDGWVLALIGLVSMFEFAAIGLLLRLVALPSPAFRRPFVVAMALPNVVAIPLSVTRPMVAR